ncbi:MAG: hypothetical protein WAX38_01820 [Minisyncoccia bacterium]
MTHSVQHSTEHNFSMRMVLILGTCIFSIVFINCIPSVFGAQLAYDTYGVEIALYYAIWVGVLFAIFPRTLAHILRRKQSILVWISALLYMCLVAYLYIAVIPVWYEYSLIHYASTVAVPDFMKGGSHYFIAKVFEILFQQLLISITILMLFKYRESYNFVLLVFASLFVLAHMTLIPKLGYEVTGIFLGAALIGSVIFPYCVLRVQHGHVLAYLVHWSFYVCATACMLYFS